MGSPKYTPMFIAIQRNKYYSDDVTENWAQCLQASGVDFKWVDLTSDDFIGQLNGCDGLMWQRGHRSQDKLESERILHSIELYLGLPVFPDHNISWHYDEKLSQYYLLQAAGVPTPKTWVFWEKGRALEWAHETDYPKVFKLSSGASGMNVVKVRTSNEATNLIHRMFGPGIYGGQIELDSTRVLPWRRRPRALARRWKSALRYIISGEPPKMPGRTRRLEKGYAYFQEFIPHEVETRVYVIGDMAWGLRRFPPPGDFRASRGPAYGGSRDINPEGFDTRCVRMAFELSDRLGFESMKYDFLLKNGEHVLTELDYPAAGYLQLTPILEFPGTWNRKLEWVGGQRQPAEAQVEVFLKRVKSTGAVPVAKVRMIPEDQS